MARMIKLAHETLVELLDYDPATGVFVWKVARSNRVKVGSRAGVLHQASGGRYISIDDEKFMAHRLAWFFMHKRWPSTDVRPIDGNYDNCALSNLTEISRVALQHGRDKTATNTSGFAGVSRAKHDKWQSKITWNYRQISLGGNFETAEEAGAVYALALESLKTATSEEDVRRVVADFRLEKRQRAAWGNLVAHSWPSFEAFAAEVRDVPERRYAMAAVDPARLIGSGNYRWMSQWDAPTGTAEGRRVHYAANKDRVRDGEFRRKYGIDFPTYQKMLVEQKGVCAICEQPETKLQHGSIRMLSVDHNHTTGAMRGLLCGNCNMAIGYACDNPDILRKAIAYLNRHNGAKDNVVPFEPAIVGGILGNST